MAASGLPTHLPSRPRSDRTRRRTASATRGEHEASERSREEWAAARAASMKASTPSDPRRAGQATAPSSGRRQGTGELAGHEAVRKSAH